MLIISVINQMKDFNLLYKFKRDMLRELSVYKGGTKLKSYNFDNRLRN